MKLPPPRPLKTEYISTTEKASDQSVSQTDKAGSRNAVYWRGANPAEAVQSELQCGAGIFPPI
ncbi:MAG: hypothetical protein CMK07_09650 [Ponticaulis sp.]|nr:hypothetical protein [Ponticaulis sp.]